MGGGGAGSDGLTFKIQPDEEAAAARAASGVPTAKKIRLVGMTDAPLEDEVEDDFDMMDD